MFLVDTPSRTLMLFLGTLLCAHLCFFDFANASDQPAYILGPGDKVRVTVYDEPDLSGELDVSDQGTVSLPLIGSINVSGKSLDDVQSEITDKYEEKYLIDPQVSVDVLNYRPFFILGEVRAPGSYQYMAGMTVLNAIALAGGYTPRARKSQIKITRDNVSPDFRDLVGEDEPVMPGDVLTVAERLF